MLNPVHLQTLITVLRAGSFADAARELGYTGSAVSQQVARLERTARVMLFDRSARGITPTPAANLLASRSHEVLAVIKDLEDDVLAIAKGRLGTVRIGSFPTASERLLPVAFQNYLASHPQVSVRLWEAESDELIGQLLDGQIDLALVYNYDLVPRAIPNQVRSVPLLEEDLQLLAPDSHRLVGRKSLSWGELSAETWITTRQSTAGAECLRHLCARANFEPQVGFRSNDYDVVREFVRSGLGLALVPSLCGGAIDGTTALPNENSMVHRRVSALHRSEGRNPLNPAVSGFLDALYEAAREISSGHVRSETRPS